MVVVKRKKKRRRTCLDQIRRNIAERQRQRRGSDPAGRLMLQLAGILSAGMALLPPMPSFSFGMAYRKSVSSSAGRTIRPRLYDDGRASTAASRDTESRYTWKRNISYLDNEDRGPTAHAMERGIDPPFYRTTSRAAPTWSKLLKDLKRRQTADKARELIEFRVPPEAVEWLRSRIYLEDWQSLRLLGRDGAGDDEIAAAALVEAQRWKTAQTKPPEPDQKPEPDGSGDPDSGAAPKP